jgi:cytochrome c biogenesis protein CcmG/thiol:disulfide interchange protein DsbE
MNRLAALAPLLLLLAVVAVSALLLLRGGERETFTAGLVGRPVPAYALAPLSGEEQVTSGALRGRAHLINVFASWCTPCRAEHSQLVALQQQGVAIVGVAYKDAPEDTARFLAELGNPFSVVGMDPDGRFGLELGITGAPETYVIGADGIVREVYRGPLTEEVVQQTILPALNER